MLATAFALTWHAELLTLSTPADYVDFLVFTYKPADLVASTTGTTMVAEAVMGIGQTYQAQK
jgi:hypothetical protein